MFNSGFDHQLAKIFNDRIVWQDVTSTLGTIHLYNLTSGIEIQVTDNTSYVKDPAIDDNLISYTDCGSDPSCGSSTIYLYNIGTGARIPLSTGSDAQDYSSISGNRIVWQDTPSVGINQIYLNGTTPILAAAIDPSGNNQANPAIYTDILAYADCGSDPLCGSNSVIYIYNITSSARSQISPGSVWVANPALYGDQIVWQEANTYGTPSQIFLNGTLPSAAYSLTPNEPLVDHQYPAIAGRWVVWYQTNQTHTTNSDIFVNDTSSHQKIPIALDRNGIEQVSIAYSSTLSLYRIVWDEQDTSGYNIYLYTSGPTQTCPVASFTNDFAGGNAPATVHFNDTSTQDASVTHWYWDFGDGSNSTLQDPAHTYSANGQYSVSLTVSDLYCRNTTTITKDIIVGAPIAGFTASPTSGAVPASIAFTDTSTGSPAPNQWNWSWGDGHWTNGTVQNPTYQYTSAGTFSVTLIVSNLYGSGSVTKTNYIQILNGANVNTNTSINGLTLATTGSRQVATLDDSVLAQWTYPLYPNVSVLEFTPPSDRGFGNVTLYACDGFGFGTSGHIHTGNITSVHMQSKDIVPTGFSVSTGGPSCSVNYSIDLTTYPVNAILNAQVWEGTVSPDTANFNTVVAGSGFGGTNGTAYTIKISKTNFPSGGSAVLHVSLNASWVASKPGGRNDVFVERIDDSGSYGQVLGTQFLSNNPSQNLDYFEVDSPKGLSTFGLSFLSGTGNLFQLVTLTVSSVVANSNLNSGGPGSGHVAMVATPAVIVSPVATVVPTPIETPDPGKTANLYINANSVITQATNLQSNDHLAAISIGEGIVAQDNTGKALSSVSIAKIPAQQVPTGVGEVSTFGGMAYDLGPSGATFSPAVTLTFTNPQATWGTQYTIKSYDHATNTWQDLPTAYDPSTGTITAKISHFCCFALFAVPISSPNSAGAPMMAALVTVATPSPPAPTAVSTFVGILGWILDTTAGHVYIVAVAAIALVALLIARHRRVRRRRRWD